MAQESHGQAKHTLMFLSQTLPESFMPSRPITLIVWDKPSIQELSRSAFQGCTDTLRVSSYLPPVHIHSPASWVSGVVVKALLRLRSFDPHVKALSITFAVTTVQICLCMAVKGSCTLTENRQALCNQLDDDAEMLWKKMGDVLYSVESHDGAQLTAAHIAECLTTTL